MDVVTLSGKNLRSNEPYKIVKGLILYRIYIESLLKMIYVAIDIKSIKKLYIIFWLCKFYIF